MKKIQSELLNNIETLQFNKNVFQYRPKTPQQSFLYRNLALNFIKQKQLIEIDHLLQPKNGSFTQLLLTIAYMRRCIQTKQNLDNPSFNILNTLVYWVEQLKHIQSSKQIKLFKSILLPQPNTLILEQYQQLITYINFIAADILNYFNRSKIELYVDDILQVLQVILPRVYYNVVTQNGSQGQKKEQIVDVLYFNSNIQYVTRVNIQYKGLCKFLMKKLMEMDLKAHQMRQALQKACRYYLLFYKDKKLAAFNVFITAFNKSTEASKFSMSDQLLLFFKIIRKMDDKVLEKAIRQKNGWINQLLHRFGPQSIVGHPKDQVFPFNPLNIRQSIKIQAGKTRQVIVQIFQENSLFYFIFDTESHDINMKLYYLGQFQSKFEIKKLLLTKQKVSQQTKSAFLATKKGIYMLQFDNSYSWLNAKTIKLQYTILSQYSHFETNSWLKKLLELNVPLESEKNHNEPTKNKSNPESSIRQKQASNKEFIEMYEEESDQEEEQIEREELKGKNKQNNERKPVQKIDRQLKIQEKVIKNEQKKSLRQQNKKQHTKQPIKQPIKQSNKQPSKQNIKQNQKQPIKQEKISQNRQKWVKKQLIKQEERPENKPEEKKIQIIKQNQKNVQPKQQKIIPSAVTSDKKQVKQIERKQIKQIKQIKKTNFKQKQQKTPQQKLPSSQKSISQSSQSQISKSYKKSQYNQANLSLIDNIFSLLVNINDHTYQFQTNLQDRIQKRLKSYCQAKQTLQWIFNSQARDWLKRHNFKMQMRGGLTILYYQNIHP